MSKPFLQWPGGKHRVAPFLLPHFSLPCKRFFEPFCGAASVSLAVAEVGGAEEFWLNDINQDLMNCLWWAANEKSFIREARKTFNPRRNWDGAYYRIRGSFNRRDWASNSINKASMFLYLDFHCYNALIRYNAKGEFNSPYRKDRKIAAFPEQAIRDFARLMSGQRLGCQDFEPVMAACGPGDVVYNDPPYVPLTATANFTSYSAGGFTWDDQIRLAKAARSAATRGAWVVISNSNTPAARSLYPGAEIHQIEVHRSISCKASSRGKTSEIIVVYKPGT